jgi:hypothetical protein
MPRTADDPPSLRPAEEIRLIQEGDDFEDELEKEWLKIYGDDGPSTAPVA